MRRIVAFFAFSSFFLVHRQASAQFEDGQFSGNFQADVQYYIPDSTIGAAEVKEKARMNSWLNLNYTAGKLRAGIRYEAYLPPLLGFEHVEQGAGIAYRYATYQANELEITAGHFYDQFGNGTIFRAYEEKQLGIDNAIDGARVVYRPRPGVALKGIYGKQRLNFGYGSGLVRGADAELRLNNLIPALDSSANQITIGGSFVSRYQQDLDPIYILPENVSAFSGRVGFSRYGFIADAEVAYKINDPSASNGLIYKSGNSVLIRTGYSRPGFGANISIKRLDNMDFRSDRNAQFNNLTLNFLPAITRQYTYRLATIYPYATQPNGEAGFQADVVYTIPKGTQLGGKYGTNIAINFSRINAIDTVRLGNELGYEADFFKLGDRTYYQDFNVEVNKRITNNIKGTFTYIHLLYDRDQIIANEGVGIVESHIGVADVLVKLNRKHAIRTELQHLYTKKDMGSWAMALIEYSYSPHWFITLWDEYNYGNPLDSRKIHYYTGGLTYIKGGNRIGMYYGKQREGIVCIGGICRSVPAYNGFTLSVSSTF